ncbi:MAG: cytochrome c oxidase subunit 3 [Proteobacteria bacterium]|uniref:cytochrome c oxidase subunit 3 n=1 Tax=Rudaea sp. TaxID=2136325 RepID=UPI001D49120E|nr:cytochrome c oxidase subunit 3 [Pseudomonadota bacterium]MBS0568257.1 cytochrome c oxidase subunit 3 [Pseudomonadota bacterium]
MSDAAHADPNAYYVPHGTKWPIVGSFGLLFTLGGAAFWLNEHPAGKVAMPLGIAIILFMVFGWFGTVIRESVSGTYNKQVDTSFRMGMMWFIFSEVMFFAAFFGALFYARALSVPWIGGEGDGALTNFFLWKGYAPAWPTNGPSAIGGAFETIPAWGVPLLNTLILLSSGVTITIAHHALRAGKRTQLMIFLGLTILLGATFLWYQAHEYIEAYQQLNLTLGSGVYGSTFFMLTGFHGLHVTLGTIMLIVIWLRCARGHFDRDHHFGFEAVAWYWHFVDVVWLGLFLFVYVL